MTVAAFDRWVKTKASPRPACRASRSALGIKAHHRSERRVNRVNGSTGRSPVSNKVYDVPAEWAKRAWANDAKYQEMYKRSLTDPQGFWAEHGKRIDWFKPYTKVKNTSFDVHNVSIKWFEDGVTNVAHNCIDRHLPKR